MKAKLLLFSLFFSVFSFGQIADGSVAPDFTAMDISGNQHTLSSYLNEGKTVILNISATWCTPCWNYKQTGALDDIYNAYGPDGSDEVVILYIEGDATTGSAELNGSGNTVGNWVETTSFPIIDNAGIANSYQISFFPTVYRICPDGLVYEMGQLTNHEIRNSINTNCSGTLTGVNNHMNVSAEDISICEDNTTGDVEFEITNYGSNTINNMTVEISDGTQTTSETITTSLNQFGNQSFSTTSSLDSNSAYTISVTNVNSTNVFDQNTASSDLVLNTAAYTSNTIEVWVHTDNYPGETSWALFDSASNQIASGGPYQPGTEDQFGAGGPDANTTIVHNVTLSQDDCFTVELYDSFGDGMIYGNTLHGIEVVENGNSILLEEVANFGTSLNLNNIITTQQPLSVSENNLAYFKLYPNPTQDILKFESASDFSLKIFNLQGKQVANYQELGANSELNVSFLNTGVYIAEITSGKQTITQKLIIQ